MHTDSCREVVVSKLDHQLLKPAWYKASIGISQTQLRIGGLTSDQGLLHISRRSGLVHYLHIYPNSSLEIPLRVITPFIVAALNLIG